MAWPADRLDEQKKCSANYFFLAFKSSHLAAKKLEDHKMIPQISFFFISIPFKKSLKFNQCILIRKYLLSELKKRKCEPFFPPPYLFASTIYFFLGGKKIFSSCGFTPRRKVKISTGSLSSLPVRVISWEEKAY